MKHCFLKKMIHITKMIHDYVVPKYNKYYKNITIKHETYRFTIF